MSATQREALRSGDVCHPGRRLRIRAPYFAGVNTSEMELMQ